MACRINLLVAVLVVIGGWYGGTADASMWRPSRAAVVDANTSRFSTLASSSHHERLLAMRGGDQVLPKTLLPKMDAFLYGLDLMGTGVFAFSGAVTAGRKGMDLFGMILVACITAVGGGTTRDLIFNTGTVFWLKDPIYLKIIIPTAIATYCTYPYLEKKFGFKDSAMPLCIADALGLAAFAVLGTQAVINFGVENPLFWVVSGIITCCFGGIVRDVLCLQRPRVLYPERTLYITPPLLGSIVYTLLVYGSNQGLMDLTVQQAACVSFLVTFSTRVMSFNNPMRLPHWKHVSFFP